MDPVTIFFIATLMMLANGGVLGLMHKDLPLPMRPAAASWRIATLLFAGGSILFAAQGLNPPAYTLALANALVMFGFTGYLRALRQFYGLKDQLWVMVPAALGTTAVFWLTLGTADVGGRILTVSVVWSVLMVACIVVLVSQERRDGARSRRVMAGLFTAVALFVLFRAGYFVVIGVNPAFNVLGAGAWMNIATPMVAATLPVIGTTAFLLMCSERIRRQWERAASTDYLTGLPNRRTLVEMGLKRFEQARTSAASGGFGLAIVDIDHFKRINDEHGHEMGDVALKHVAGRLQSACRGAELPARQGGEEFVVLFDNLQLHDAPAAGERLRQAVAQAPFTAGDLVLPLTVSIGLAVLRADDTHFDSLLRRADEALYAAKAAGRNRVEIAPERAMEPSSMGSGVGLPA
ncbi:GGDEF domain-containing protein [Acidovorax sp.]|uniref:GGDEF domain-containing protein n=1 Tax=Acidovorax sp. TaxID=1872122 RepID=UPI0025BB2254|nr:GGDEF domain-containing protein [Acidovorax sp.]MBW8466040.1 GGDEF domain-containing protein [Acidovorax sp.]